MKKVLLLLAEGFEIYEASVFIDVMGWNYVDGDGTTQLLTCGLKKEVKSAFNHTMIVDLLVDEIDVTEFDALAVPGGFEVYGFYNDAYDERFLNVIKAFRDANKTIASICVGALPVGKSGVLQNRKGTTYNSDVRRKALKEFGVNCVNEAIVNDDNIITSHNPFTAIEVAFMLLEQLTSKKNADHIRELMGF
ncbi:DJ-1/PfpI family protein [Prolixibacteraceae bacterium JC049]|nr:DJ-1/PfpI family protein [Prolixibacteraceae bacterium JC049]